MPPNCAYMLVCGVLTQLIQHWTCDQEIVRSTWVGYHSNLYLYGCLLQKSHHQKCDASRLNKRKMISSWSRRLTRLRGYKMSWYRPQTENDSYRCSWTRWRMMSADFRRMLISFSGNMRWCNVTVRLIVCIWYNLCFSYDEVCSVTGTVIVNAVNFLRPKSEKIAAQLWQKSQNSRFE